jgi:hypothetical protein
LYGAAVGDNAHLATQSIYLSDNLTFGHTTNGRIARHCRIFGHIHCDEQRGCAKVGSRSRSLTTGMTSAHHYNVEIEPHTPLFYFGNLAR